MPSDMMSMGVSKYHHQRTVFIKPMPTIPLNEPKEFSKEIVIPITTGFMGMGSDQMCKCSVTIPKTGFQVGEHIPMRVSIDNS